MGAVAMELDTAAFQTDAFAAARTGRRGAFQPQHLKYICTAIDFALFGAAIATATAWVGAAPHDLYRLAQVFVGALLLTVFSGCCRIFQAHDPLTLIRSSGSVHLMRAVTCFGAPPLLALLVCMPFLGSADPVVHGFITWLKYLAVISLAFGTLSRAVFLLVYPRASDRIFTPQRIAIVGSGETARRMMRWVRLTAPGLVEIVGVFDDRNRQRVAGSDVAGHIRGNTADLIELISARRSTRS